MLWSWLAVASPALVVEIGGMDCAGCEQEVVDALSGVQGVQSVEASFADTRACLVLSAPVAHDVVVAALKQGGFTAANIEDADGCAERKGRDPWADPGALDIEVISRGDKVDPKKHLAAGKTTIVDFGAPWCGPCHISAKELRALLAERSDLAVRAVWLDAPDPKASFALPAAKQHLRWAPGLPWFVVYGADGKLVYEGGEVSALKDAIAK